MQLTPEEYGNCTFIQSRAFNYVSSNFGSDPDHSQLNAYTGSNQANIAAIGIYLGILSGNFTPIRMGFNVSLQTLTFTSGATDGLKADGSYLFHSGIPYSGNYGLVFIDQIFDLLGLSAGIPELNPTADQQVESQTFVPPDSFRLLPPLLSRGRSGPSTIITTAHSGLA